MKKTVRNFVIGAAMAIGVIASSAAAFANTKYVQTGMNFRNGPATSASVIGSVPEGSKVDVIGSENGWDKVVYNGTTGYIHGGNIADSYTAKPASTASSTKNYYDNNSTFSQKAVSAVNNTDGWKTVSVSSGYLALRTAPSFDASNEIGQLYSGDTVLVTGSQSNGSYVWVYSPKYNTNGYVNAGFLF